MHEHFIEALTEIIGTSGALLVSLAALVLGIMAALLPFFVYRIMRDVSTMRKNMDELVYQLRDRF